MPEGWWCTTNCYAPTPNTISNDPTPSTSPPLKLPPITITLPAHHPLTDNSNFLAYPNPVRDILNISYTTEISSVRVINMIGQEVISKNINATSTQVDMSELSAGTYIVNVTVGDSVKTLKVIKQ